MNFRISVFRLAEPALFAYNPCSANHQAVGPKLPAYSTLYMCQNRPAFGGSTIAGRSLFLLWLEFFSGATVRLGLI